MNDLNLNYARFKPALLIAVVTLAALFGLFTGAQTAIADGSGNADTVIGAGCMNDVYNAFGQGGDIGCTANDVSLATATNIAITDDGCAFPGDTVSFSADFQVDVTASTRYDVGIYLATDGDPNGDGAISGQCSISTPAYAPTPDWLDLDGTTNDTKNSNDFGYCSTDGGTSIALRTTDPLGPVPCDGGSPAGGDAQCVAALGAGATCEEFSGLQDTCGEISKPDFSPLFPTITLTVSCVDDDNDGKLDLPYCTSWRQPGANELCLTPLAAYPGTTSKCVCDPGFSIDIFVPGQIIVDKVTDPANDPTSFDFELTGPDGDLPVNFSLTDQAAPYASPGLDAGTYSVTETPNPYYRTTSSCDDGSDPSAIDLQPGETVTCTFVNTAVKDWGDAPTAAQSGLTNSYPTLSADSGASHIIGGPYLGACVDAELDGQPDTLAGTGATGGDDNDGSAATVGACNGDDEDGVSVSPLTGAATTVGLEVTVNNPTNDPATLACWVDLNRDGVFGDMANESESSPIAPGTTATVLPLTFDNGSAIGNDPLYIRCRIASDPADVDNPTGAANSGEVEDHFVDPTDVQLAVTLSYFLAERDGEMVRFEWETASETANAGFDLLDTVGGKVVVVTEEMIPSKVIDSVTLTQYTYEASAGDGPFYIELVGLNDVRTRSEPFALGEVYGTPSVSDDPTQDEMTEAIFIPFIAFP